MPQARKYRQEGGISADKHTYIDLQAWIFQESIDFFFFILFLGNPCLLFL